MICPAKESVSEKREGMVQVCSFPSIFTILSMMPHRHKESKAKTFSNNMKTIDILINSEEGAYDLLRISTEPVHEKIPLTHHLRLGLEASFAQ